MSSLEQDIFKRNGCGTNAVTRRHHTRPHRESLSLLTFMVSGTVDMERNKDPRALRTTLVKEATSMVLQRLALSNREKGQ